MATLTEGSCKTLREGAGRVELAMTATGEAAEFARLVRAQLPGAYRLAGFLLGDAAEAEDAIQDAMEKAWLAWPKLRDPDRFGAWFDRIVANVCHDRLRSRGKHRVLQLDETIAGHSCGDPFRDALARDELGRLIRIVVGLRFWRDMPLDQIADRLGLPLGTVKSRLHYAMRSLRQQLDRKPGEVRP
jgi:DNA-directed RNA polymerase specialized sigma24 family protein